MADFELHIRSYRGFAPGAVHFYGRVQGEYPQSCHGGTVYHGAEGPLQGKTTCSENHVLPGRVEWDVEAPWTRERYERYVAARFEGDGPNAFRAEQDVIDAAVRRFTGQVPHQRWEEDVTAGQPGDRLYLGYRALHPDDVDGKWGSVIAEIPAAQEATA